MYRTLVLNDSKSQSHGLSGLACTRSNVMLGFTLRPDQFHGLSGLACTRPHVILGFALRPDQFHGLSGLDSMH